VLEYARVLDVQLLAPQTTRALRREEYDRLVAMGAFEDERVELIEGVLVTIRPNDPQHASPVQLLSELLLPVLLGRAVVRIQLPIIAASGFLEYWLVNVPEQAVEVFRAPGPDGYAQLARYPVGETIALETFPDVRIEVASLF